MACIKTQILFTSFTLSNIVYQTESNKPKNKSEKYILWEDIKTFALKSIDEDTHKTK